MTNLPTQKSSIEISQIRGIVSRFGIQQVQACAAATHGCDKPGFFTFYDRDRFQTSNPCRMGQYDESGFVIGIRNRDLPASLRKANRLGRIDMSQPVEIAFEWEA